MRYIPKCEVCGESVPGTHAGCLADPKKRNLGALRIRRGFWGPLYYNYKQEPPKMI